MRISALAVIAAIATTSTAAEAAPARFNLECRGVQEKKTGMKSAEWRESFRIDLQDKRWCRGACRTGAAIGYITPDAVTIQDGRASTGGPPDVVVTISRVTGKVTEHIEMGWSGSTFELANGTCVVKEYTGIPANRF